MSLGGDGLFVLVLAFVAGPVYSGVWIPAGVPHSRLVAEALDSLAVLLLDQGAHNIFGFGATIMLPTASDDQLGTGKYSAGPMALAFRITDEWIIGGILQHWWSFAGEDTFNVSTSAGQISVDRPDVNLTDFQYVLRYRLSPKTNIGVAPNVRYNWETDELNFPIGLGGDTLIKIGPLPVKIGLEAYYYVARDDNFGPEWQLRFLFIPIVPSPEWSKHPLF